MWWIMLDLMNYVDAVMCQIYLMWLMMLIWWILLLWWIVLMLCYSDNANQGDGENIELTDKPEGGYFMALIILIIMIVLFYLPNVFLLLLLFVY